MSEHIDLEDTIGIYYREIAPIAVLSAKEEVTLAKRVERDGPRSEAAAFFVKSNLKLVPKVAKKYRNRGVPDEDLLQFGNEGLIRAVEKFDYRKGFKFSTYAYWWINQGILRGLANEGRLLRIPVHANEEINKMKKYIKAYDMEHGHEPTDQEIHQELGLSKTNIKLYRDTALGHPVPIDKSINEDSEIGDIMSVEGQSIDHSFVGATQNDLQRVVKETTATLSQREYQVLNERFGLEDGIPKTLEQVGNIMGVTRERIRQIEAKAIQRMRHPSRSAKLAEFYLE